MKLEIRVAVILMVILFIGKNCFAQDPTFSQFNLNQFYYNPAFTGDHRGYQLAATYHTLWPNVPGKVFPGPLTTYYGLFDAFLQKGNSYTAGAGVFAMQNIEGEGFLKTTTFGVSYAQHFTRIGGRGASLPRIQLSLGFKTYLNSISINWDKLIFSDQLSIEHGVIGESSFDESGIGHKLTADLDAGLLLKNNFHGKDKWYNEVGVSMAHLLTPSLSMTSSDDEYSKLPKKYGGSYRTTVSLKDDCFYIGTTLLFEKQKDFSELNSGLDFYIRPDPLNPVIPLWFSIMHRVSVRHERGYTNALIGSLRYRWLMGKKTRAVYSIGFSADIPYSGLALKSKGAYEASIGVVFPRRGNNVFIRCPYGTF